MIYELVKESRSYRGYDNSRSVTRQELTHLIECARLCPSSVNMQVLKYYIAYEEKDVKTILPLTKWGRALPQLTLPHPGMEPTGFVVICHDTSITNSIGKGFEMDIGAAAQTILLAAVEMGLGGCMIGNFEPEGISSALLLADNLVPKLIVAIGKPAETIVLTELTGNTTKYYRDENDIHYVPKRALDDIILN